MKCLLVVIIALVAFVAADEEWKPISDKKVLTEIIADCKKESGITSKQLSDIDGLEQPADEEMRAYSLCGATKMGVFTEDKGYIVDRFMAVLDVFYEDVENVRDTVTDCLTSSAQNSTPGLKALRGQQCLLRSKFSQKLKERPDKV